MKHGAGRVSLAVGYRPRPTLGPARRGPRRGPPAAASTGPSRPTQRSHTPAQRSAVRCTLHAVRCENLTHEARRVVASVASPRVASRCCCCCCGRRQAASTLVDVHPPRRAHDVHTTLNDAYKTVVAAAAATPSVGATALGSRDFSYLWRRAPANETPRDPPRLAWQQRASLVSPVSLVSLVCVVTRRIDGRVRGAAARRAALLRPARRVD